VDNAALAAQLQREGTQSFDKSWNELMDTIVSKSYVLGKTTETGGKP
jgi:transaldolase